MFKGTTGVSWLGVACVACVAFALATLRTTVAVAQDVGTPPAPPQAQRLYAQCVETQRARSVNWRVVLAYCEQTCAIYPAATCFAEVADANYHLQRWVDAARAIERYRATLTGTPRARIREIQDEVYTHVGRLQVRLVPGTMPEGVVVSLDGTPIDPSHFHDEDARLIVEPGTHVLGASGPEREGVRQEVEVDAGHNRAVTLPTPIERRARLHILPVGGVVPRGVVIAVDGRAVPGTHYDDPRERIMVLPGIHEIEVRGPNREPAHQRIDVAAGQDLPVSVVIPREVIPIHHRWWFWTGVGVLVAGTGATAAVLATRENPPSPTIADVQAIQRGAH
jgi:hypothetical protein